MHVRTGHEKRRDHACPHCATAFGRVSSLTRHVRTLHRQCEQSGDAPASRGAAAAAFDDEGDDKGDDDQEMETSTDGERHAICALALVALAQADEPQEESAPPPA